MEQSSVYSLTAASTNILMWSHYADSHKGICIRLETDLLAAAYPFIVPVDYADERPQVNVGEEMEDVLLTKTLLTKSLLWKYEAEWRIVGYGERKGPRRLPKGSISGMIMGARISTEHRDRIINLIDEHDLPISPYDAREDNRLFAINLVPANQRAENERQTERPVD